MSASMLRYQFGLPALLVLTTLVAVAFAILRTGPVLSTLSLIASVILAVIFLLGAASLTGQTAGEAVTVLFLTAIVGASTGAGLTKLFFFSVVFDRGYTVPTSFVIGALIGSIVSVIYVFVFWHSKTRLGRRLRLPRILRQMMANNGWERRWECMQCHTLSGFKFDKCPQCGAFTNARQDEYLGDQTSAKSVVLAVVAALLAFVVIERGPRSGADLVLSTALAGASCIATLLGYHASIRLVAQRKTSKSGGGFSLVWHGIVLVFWIAFGTIMYLDW